MGQYWLPLNIIIIFFFADSYSFAFQNPNDFFNNPSQHKVLIFLSQSCPCSRSHVDHLNQLQKMYPDVAFFGVITDIITSENEQEIGDYYQDQNFKFPLIRDDQQKLIIEYRALKTPHVVLVKSLKESQVTTLYEGGLSDQRHFNPKAKMFLGENLKALHENKTLPYREGRSLGCYIRRLQ